MVLVKTSRRRVRIGYPYPGTHGGIYADGAMRFRRCDGGGSVCYEGTAGRPCYCVEDVTMCGTCEACKMENTFVPQYVYALEGQSGMGEYLCVHENMLNRYEGIDDIVACVTEPLAVCLNIFRWRSCRRKESLSSWGPILGIMTAALAKHYGAMRVACVGSRPGKRSAAASAAAKNWERMRFLCFRADYTGKIKEHLWRRGDAVIVTCRRGLSRCNAVAAYGANIVNIGLDFGKAVVPVNIDDLVFNKNNIISVCRACKDDSA